MTPDKGMETNGRWPHCDSATASTWAHWRRRRGTFTDLVLADATGAIWVAKVPSVPADPDRGVYWLLYSASPLTRV